MHQGMTVKTTKASNLLREPMFHKLHKPRTSEEMKYVICTMTKIFFLLNSQHHACTQIKLSLRSFSVFCKNSLISNNIHPNVKKNR